MSTQKQTENCGRMQKTILIKYINITVVLTTVIIISLAMVILNRPEVSEIERRALAAFPEFSFSSLFSGEYTAAIDKYYTDTVPERDYLKTLCSYFDEYKGIRINNIKFHGDINQYNDDTGEDTDDWYAEFLAGLVDNKDENDTGETISTGTEAVTGEPVTTDGEPADTVSDSQPGSEQESETAAPPETGNDNGDLTITNGIVTIGTRGIMLYGGTKKVGARYAQIVNNYKTDLGSGVNVFSMSIPTAVSFYLPKEYSSYTANQKSHIDYVSTLLKGVADVDVYSSLLEHKGEEIYLRTDHHWAPLGAYYASSVFASDAGVPFADLSSYKKITVDGYVGSLYGYTKDVTLRNNPEKFIYYKPANTYSVTFYDMNHENPFKHSLFFKTSVGNSYCSFLGNDKYIAEIKTDVGNGRKLLIIKDSYGNAIVPFLTGSFEEIYVIDLRYFTLNVIDYIKDNGITDVLFALCTFDTCGGNYAYLEMIRTQTAEN